MGILASILAALGSSAFSSLLAPITDIVKSFMSKEISEAEAAEKLASAITEWSARVEIAHAETVSKTFESFQQTLRSSSIVQHAWAFLFYSQTVVLVWHQFGIPALLFFVYEPGTRYPSSGGTVEWAYLLLGFMLGASSLMLKPSGVLASAGTLLRSIRSKV